MDCESETVKAALPETSASGLTDRSCAHVIVMSLQLDIHLDGEVVESLTETGPDTPVHEAPPTWVDDEPAGKSALKPSEPRP